MKTSNLFFGFIDSDSLHLSDQNTLPFCSPFPLKHSDEQLIGKADQVHQVGVACLFKSQVSQEDALDEESRMDESLTEQPRDSTVKHDEKAEFFRNQWPVRWYSLKTDAEGRIKIALPKYLRKTKRIIYIFRNQMKQCFLIGKTGGSLNARMSRYTTEFNQQSIEKRIRKEGRKAFLEDVKRHPTKFGVGILPYLEFGRGFGPFRNSLY